MIRIISKNGKVQNNFPMRVICENCETEFECDEEDTYIGALGAYHVKCPVCGDEIMIDGGGIELTKDNLRFPTHYFKPTGRAVKLDNTTVDGYVRKCIKHLETIDNKEYWGTFTGSGDTMVFVYKMDGDEGYLVYVGKNVYETHIPFETKDYTFDF